MFFKLKKLRLNLICFIMIFFTIVSRSSISKIMYICRFRSWFLEMSFFYIWFFFLWDCFPRKMVWTLVSGSGQSKCLKSSVFSFWLFFSQWIMVSTSLTSTVHLGMGTSKWKGHSAAVFKVAHKEYSLCDSALLLLSLLYFHLFYLVQFFSKRKSIC